jgi:hypothetical protein
MNKVLVDIEKLKDRQRTFANGNGAYKWDKLLV